MQYNNDNSRIRYLEKKLNENFVDIPFHKMDENYKIYQQRVLNTLLSREKCGESIHSFLSKVDKEYDRVFPSEEEMEWYCNDKRASLWLACELYESMSFPSNIYVEKMSPEALLPDHDVRILAIRDCIDYWNFLDFTAKEYIIKKRFEWAGLMEGYNIFGNVSAKNVDVSKWLYSYIKNKTDVALERPCGDTSEEMIAWCYASFFVWKGKSENSSDLELFILKFKSAWSTQKNRIKTRVEKKLKPLNVNISQQAYDMLRDMSIKGGISNDKVVEGALKIMYERNKR